MLTVAHLNSQDGKMGQVELLGPFYCDGVKQDNVYVFKRKNKLYTGIMNWFVGEYYVDDKYGLIIPGNNNYELYKGEIEQ